MLQLKRPLVFIDLETTGLDRENDRIVQIALYKTSLDNGFADEVYEAYVNPGSLISPASTAIHGITDEMVRDEPKFEEIAGEVFSFILGCDFAGFNSNWFDIPLLANEFARCGLTLDPKAFNMIDVGNLFKIKEPRNLEKAIGFYVEPMKRSFGPAHDALSDVTATVEVFKSQLLRYTDLPATVEELALYTNYNCKVADLSGKFVYREDGLLLLNFGKHKGQPAKLHLDFLHWMYFKASFAPDTRAICEELLGLNEPVVLDFDSDELPF